MKPVRGFVYGAQGKESAQILLDGKMPSRTEVLILPIEGDNVGGLEPWMVKYIRDPHPDYLPEGMKKTQLAASHAIAAAIAAILKEAEDETN